MYDQAICADSGIAISSLALAAGRLHFAPQDGQMIDLFGPVPVLANLTARQAKELGLLTSGTFGRTSTTLSPSTKNGASSKSAKLQSLLESRLQARLPLSGSTLYKLTWKHRATPSGRLICALRASALSTSGSGFTGLPTPSGTSNHGKNHVAGRMDEWGGSGNPFRGTEIGRLHLPSFELLVMGFPAAWRELMPPAMPSSRKSRKPLSNP